MEPDDKPQDPGRREFVSSVTGWFMAGGLAAGYGACAAMGGRYLFPPGGEATAWLFVARVDELAAGDSMAYRAPSGQRVAIARQTETGEVSDFVALSSTCPHLGCQVHWEAQNDRFFCPCHNGVFDPAGSPLEGPPAEADQSLPRFPLKIVGGLLYIEVPVETLSGSLTQAAEGQRHRAPRLTDRRARLERVDCESPPGAGHDPCLYPDGPRPGPSESEDPGQTA